MLHLHLLLRLASSVLLLSCFSASPPPSKWSATGPSLSTDTVAEIVILTIIVFGAILSACYWYYMKTNHQKGTTRDVVDIEMPLYENERFTFQVLDQATNHFNDENVVGRGGYGVVYRGWFDNHMIAVKRMNPDNIGDKCIKQFQAEIKILTKTRHKNLVTLLGYYIDDNEKLLVYEYMSQGSLSQHLFSWREKRSEPLNWKERVSIAYDVARGIEYLHTLAEHTSYYVHRDIKSTNILLGDDLGAKIADFGLAKSVHKDEYVRTKPAGTLGYMPPEYAVHGEVTTKMDVYAFGIVLMELVTGTKAIDEDRPQEQLHLGTWFKKVDDLLGSVDETLDQSGLEIQASIKKVAELAVYCTAYEARKRPEMRYVVDALHPLVDVQRPTSCSEEEMDSYAGSPPIWQLEEGTSTWWMTDKDMSMMSCDASSEGR